MASRPGAREATWQRATTDESVTNDQLRASSTASPSPPTRPPRYAERYFASLTGWWAGRTQTMATILARGLFPVGSLDDGQRPEQHPVVQQARAWLHDHEASMVAWDPFGVPPLTYAEPVRPPVVIDVAASRLVLQDMQKRPESAAAPEGMAAANVRYYSFDGDLLTLTIKDAAGKTTAKTV